MKSTFIAGLLFALGSAEKSYKPTYERPSIDDIKLQQFPSANIDSLYGSSGVFKDAKRAEFGAIRGAQETIITPTRSIDSLFLRLPSET